MMWITLLLQSIGIANNIASNDIPILLHKTRTLDGSPPGVDEQGVQRKARWQEFRMNVEFYVLSKLWRAHMNVSANHSSCTFDYG